MGRHRRATPAAAPTSNPRGHRKRGRTPVRTSIIGASAAVAVGAVAATSGVVPGMGSGFPFGDKDDAGSRVQADATPEIDLHGPPPETTTRGGVDEDTASPDRGRSASPSASDTADDTDDRADTAKPSASPEKTTRKPRDEASQEPAPRKPSKSPTPAKPSSPAKPPSKSPSPPGNSAEAQVLNLVNQERARAGCQPVRADSQLASLARDYSADMAARGFFDHTDPDGNSPWDRAKARGIDNMGGENIARGQASAESVMKAWMDSPGHRANILNCDFKTLGVGAHFAQGGPWWTQAFGY